MKKTKRKVTRHRIGSSVGIGGKSRLDLKELERIVREVKLNAPKRTYRKGPNGIEIRPEDTASGKGLISFRVFPPETKTRRKP